jgi:hypothetical protein
MPLIGSQSPSLVSIMSQMNIAYTSKYYFFKIYFNTVHVFDIILPFRFPNLNFTLNFPLSQEFYMPHPRHILYLITLLFSKKG